MFQLRYKRRRSRALQAACAGAALVVAAGCDSGSQGSSEGSRASGSKILTIGISADTSTLDPTRCFPQPICFPAYDALIYRSALAEYQPDLALSAKFTDKGHETLRLEIRQGAYFTDGSELDRLRARITELERKSAVAAGR